MSITLTCKQDAILHFAVQYMLINGHPPTLREIGAEFGIRSTNGVHDHLSALRRKGYLLKLPNVARGMKFSHAAFARVPSPVNAVLRYVPSSALEGEK